MKFILIFVTLVTVSSAGPLCPNWPPLNNWPGLRPTPPPNTEHPQPIPPIAHPDVRTEVLNFPSNDNPQIRVHVNIKQHGSNHPSHRPVRSLWPWQWPGNKPEIIVPMPELPPTGLPEQPPVMPELPPIGLPGQPPISPELPPTGLPIHPPIHLPGQPPIIPELPPTGLPGQPPIPEIPSIPGFPLPEGTQDTFIYLNPGTGRQIVKLRVQYNKQHPSQVPVWTPYKIDINGPNVDPIYPGVPETPGNLPEVPGPEGPEWIPMPSPNPIQPQVELFLDIGEDF